MHQNDFSEIPFERESGIPSVLTSAHPASDGQVSEILLTDEEVSGILSLDAEISVCPSTDAVAYCDQVRYLAHRLPHRVQEMLRAFREHGSPTGHLLISTLPVADLGPTPEGNIYKRGERTPLARCSSLLLSLIAHPIAYEAEGYGRLFQDIVPIRAMKGLQTSNGSALELEIHTEQAFSSIKPDILVLACLRGDEQARTYILPVSAILANLSAQERELAREPLWTTGVDLSFKMHDLEFIDGNVRGPMPILSGPTLDPRLTFDQDLMKGTTLEAQLLIEKIVSIYYGHRLARVLSPGQIVFVDNRRAVHGRSPFSPRWDGSDRFLVRCFGVLDLEATSHARPGGGRVAAAIYS